MDIRKSLPTVANFSGGIRWQHEQWTPSDRGHVCSAMQLVKDPAMIFLDEPTSGLDSEMACQVMDSLISLARRDRLVRSPRSRLMSYL